jgi:hypothetical protein
VSCKICGKDKCYAHCQVAEDGKHEVDTTSADSHQCKHHDDDGNIIVDFNCKNCGQGGSISVKVADIAWE